jgi:thymidine phosphorylase
VPSLAERGYHRLPTREEATVHAVDVIRAKRDGHRLSDDQIDWVVAAYTRGEVADEQMAALAMAILLRGMDRGEVTRWTAAMIASGERMDLSAITRPTVDKHSTGGVGDKITLPLAPLVAACGAAVPQLSGRGLGHTGGTLDKLEAIPGWRAQLSREEYLAQLHDVGAVVCAAGDTLAPADRKLYALRDVTGTVESIPLIASSIMSKKLAEGAAALVLDVKVGTGAFMRTAEDARELAGTMVAIGGAAGVRTVALLTAMDTPLGRTAGHALEVAEAVEVLAGGGPPDVVELTVALAREMVAAAGLSDVDPADVLASGKAMDVWRAMVAAQGGDPDAALPTAPVVETVRADSSGVLSRLDAYAVGVAAWRLGAGRARKEDPVSASAGVVMLRKPGEPVHAGEPLLELHTEDAGRLPGAIEALAGGLAVAAGAVERGPLVLDRVTSG